MSKRFGIVTSTKASAVLMAVLSLLFLLNVSLPQKHLLGAQAIENAAAGSVIKRFFLIDLGFGNMPTSPIFLIVLTLFFINLTAVLITRASVIARRIRAKTPSVAQLKRKANSKDAVHLPRPAGWNIERAGELLRGLGYRVERPGEGYIFAEKNRRALLGFLIFHLSFFPVLAGALMLYYTRHESQVILIEGQDFRPEAARSVRSSPLGTAPDFRFTLGEVAPRFEDGMPTQLVANVTLATGGDDAARTAMINHPVRVGHVDILVEQIGVAPAFRIWNREGETLDFVAAVAPRRPEEMTMVPLGDPALGLELEVEPIDIDHTYGDRDQLAKTGITLRLLERGGHLYRDTLRPGEYGVAGNYNIKLEEVRFWARFRIVSERGGWVLIGGFIAAVIGLVWRMGFIRREVGIAADDDEVVLFGNSEFYKGSFREELEALAAVVVEEAGSSEGRET